MDLFKRKQGDLVVAYQKVFATPEGDLILKDLMKIGYVDRTTFAPDSQYETAFREGQRALVLRLIQIINTDPDYLAQLMKGQSEERR